MAGISRAERDRRNVEDAMAHTELPFRDPECAVIWVGPVQRGFCRPCQRRDWGAQIRIDGADVFRCQSCMAVMASQLLGRANASAPGDRPALCADGCRLSADGQEGER
jgi:hypothetical protein